MGVALMNTMVKPKQRSYKSFFNEANRDIVLITKYSTNISNEIQQLKAIQIYWNEIVKKTLYWMNLAGQELDEPSINKIHRYLRGQLLDSCHKAIADTDKCKTSSFKAIEVKKNLMEEYEDRLLYLKINF